MTNRPPSNPAHLTNIPLNVSSSIPQYDRSTIPQATPSEGPHIPEVIDPDDDTIIPLNVPMRSQNCKSLFLFFFVFVCLVWYQNLL